MIGRNITQGYFLHERGVVEYQFSLEDAVSLYPLHFSFLLMIF